MAPELSSNWKKLQEKLKVESSSAKPAQKRKATDESIISKPPPSKRQKAHPLSKPTTKPTSKPSSKPASKPPKPPTKMGAAQSQPTRSTASLTTHPSLSLFATATTTPSSSTTITLPPTESLAEAYRLGISSPSLTLSLPTTPNAGLSPSLLTPTGLSSLGKYLALDCEMVGLAPTGHSSALARVSLVDFHFTQIYDSYVLPQPNQTITDYRTHVSGITPKHLLFARPFSEVQSTVSSILQGRILVGHDVKHDLAVLELDHPGKMIRDTAKYSGFKKYGHGPKPALRVLAREILGVEVQSGVHSSVEDARVAMLLFRREKQGFDGEIARRYGEEERESGGRKEKGGGKGGKKGGSKGKKRK